MDTKEMLEGEEDQVKKAGGKKIPVDGGCVEKN